MWRRPLCWRRSKSTLRRERATRHARPPTNSDRRCESADVGRRQRWRLSAGTRARSEAAAWSGTRPAGRKLWRNDAVGRCCSRLATGARTHPIDTAGRSSVHAKNRVELCAAAAAADRMSASRRRRFREVFTSRCTIAIHCMLLDFCNAVHNESSTLTKSSKNDAGVFCNSHWYSNETQRRKS